MKKGKIATICLAATLAGVALVGGTMAYFTDTTESATNAFTVGKVGIELSEDAWKPAESHTLMPGTSYAKDPTITVDDNSQDAYVFLKVELNKYVSLVNLMGVDAYKNNIGGLTGEYPGFTAFAQNIAGDSTLRAAVLDRWFTGINHADWKVMNLDEITAAVSGAAGGTNPTKLEVILGYIGSDDDTLSAGESVTFMTAFGMPATVTNSMLDGDDAYKINGVSKSNFNTDSSDFKMTFTAYAIQAAEISDIDAAYDALF